MSEAPERIYWTPVHLSPKHDTDVDALGVAWRFPDKDRRVAFIREDLARAAPTVKPLEWQTAGRDWCAVSAVGVYYVQWDDETGHWFAALENDAPDHHIIEPGDQPSLDDAKAAAQADYELRILSALE